MTRTARAPRSAASRSSIVGAFALSLLIPLLPSSTGGRVAVAVGETGVAGIWAAAPTLAPRGATVVLAAERPGDNTSGGTQLLQAVSADGQWVAFASQADDLVSGDTNKTADMFLRDRAHGTTTRFPWVDGRQLSRTLAASEPTITADGSVVVYVVGPKTTVPVAALAVVVPQAPALVRYQGGKTSYVATDPDGVPLRGTEPSISGDGTVLAYTSPDVVPHVIVRSSNGVLTIPSGPSSHPSVSSDGRFVALQAADPSGRTDVYRYDRSNGNLLLISKVSNGGPANGSSFAPSISGDGSVIAFASTATNLTADAGLDGTSQIYAWSAASGSIRLLSTDRTGAPGRGASSAPAISVDARFVAFDSVAPGLDTSTETATTASPSPSGSAAATLAGRDVFVHDLVNGQTIDASLSNEGSTSGGDSGSPSISGDGGVVAFDSTGPALLGGAANGFRQVFVREWTSGPALAPDPLDFGFVVTGQSSGEATVTVSDLGWAPFSVAGQTITGSNPGDFVIGTTDCAGKRLYFRDTCRIGITFTPGGLGPRTATLQLTTAAGAPGPTGQLIGTGVTTATPTLAVKTPAGLIPTPPGPTPSVPQPTGGVLSGSASNPQLILDPPLGPPGFVTIAIGSGFPSGADVSLVWDRGITAAMPPVHVGADGTFRVGVLILPKSEPGPRSLVATGAGGPGFSSVNAQFLVVLGTAQPPASGAVEFIAPGVSPIVDRR